MNNKIPFVPKFCPHIFISSHSTENVYENIKTTFYNFIWDDPIDRIKREIL